MQNKSQNHRVSIPFQLLKTFTEKELINFEKLLNSGYLSERESLNKLLSILKKRVLHHPSFTSGLQYVVYKELYSKEKIEAKLQPAQSKKLNRFMNELLTAAEKFLMFERIKQTEEHNPLLLFPELINRNQLLLYRKRIKATEKKLSNVKKQGLEYHNQCFYIQKEKARLNFLSNTLAKEDNYDELEYHQDVIYLLLKLRYQLAKATLKRRYAHKNYNDKSFIALKYLINLPKYQQNPLIKLSYLNVKLLESDNESIFKELLNIIKEKQNFIPANFLKPFYTNLTNYCVKQEAKGKLEFTKYTFKIYNSMHEGNLLTDNTISIGLLKNIITIACRVSEFDWAIDKLAYYISYVPKAIRDDVFKYNSGIIMLNQGNYREALNLFAKVKKINDTYDLGLRVAQLQCFYEAGNCYEIGTTQITESLRVYINTNKKLVTRQKTAYLNFITTFNKIYKFKGILDRNSSEISIKKALPKLKDTLSHYELIREKRWLLQKIEALINY